MEPPPPYLSELPVLETARLKLRKVGIGDTAALFSYFKEEAVHQYSLGQAHKTLADSSDYIEGVIRGYESNVSGLWAIELRESPGLIGLVGYEFWMIDQFRAEIGYSLHPRYWNKGFITEALREIISFGFNTMSLNRIEAYCHVHNIASHRVLEKLGFENEGTLKKHSISNGEFFDVYLFSKLNEG